MHQAEGETLAVAVACGSPVQPVGNTLHAHWQPADAVQVQVEDLAYDSGLSRVDG